MKRVVLFIIFVGAIALAAGAQAMTPCVSSTDSLAVCDSICQPTEGSSDETAQDASLISRVESWYAANGGFYYNNGFFILPPMALIIVGIIIWVHRSRNKDLCEN